MYVREEHIEEENLDWEEHTRLSIDNHNNVTEETREEAVEAPVSKQNKPFLNNRANMGRKVSLKRELNDLLKQNAEISLLFGIVLIPYLLGFLISYFLFFFYGGMPISHFLDVQKVPTTIELWSIGAYVFVTVGAALSFLLP